MQRRPRVDFKAQQQHTQQSDKMCSFSIVNISLGYKSQKLKVVLLVTAGRHNEKQIKLCK